MYPYNTSKTNHQNTNNLKSSNAKLIMSEEEMTVQDILINEMNDKEHNYQYYSALSEKLTDSADAETVKSMAFDEYKHKRLLEEIYYALTETMPEKTEVKIEPISNNINDEFTNTFFKELEAVEMNRELMASFENQSVKDLFFEILTDEQAHAAILNYLIQKYNTK